jgi:hypothetical protein
MIDELPDEYYCWVDFSSTRNFDVGLWGNFQVAERFGRHRLRKMVRCKICGSMVGWSGCTGNLRKHLQVYHQEATLPPEIRTHETLRDKISALGDLPNDQYFTILESLLNNKGAKYPIWNFYERKEYVVRYVCCRICRREVYWNQTGLEKLKRHVEGVHLKASKRRKMDELYRFCITMGVDEFLEVVKMKDE